MATPEHDLLHYVLSLATQSNRLPQLVLQLYRKSYNPTSTQLLRLDQLFFGYQQEASSDQQLLYWLKFAYQQQNIYDSKSSQTQIVLSSELGAQILPALLASKRCYWLSIQNAPLQEGPALDANLEWETVAPGLKRLSCHIAGRNCVVLGLNPLWYVDQQRRECGLVKTGVAAEVVNKLLSTPPLNDNQIKALYAALGQSAFASKPSQPAVAKNLDVAMIPQLHLSMVSVIVPNPYEVNKELIFRIPALVVWFNYHGHLVAPNDERNPIMIQRGAKQYQIQRDFDAEKTALAELIKLNLQDLSGLSFKVIDQDQHPVCYTIAQPEDVQAWLAFNVAVLPKIRELNWQINTSNDYPYFVVDENNVEWYTQFHETSGQRWFNVELGIYINGEKINLLPLLVAAIEKYFSEHEEQQQLSDDGYLLTKLPDGRLLPVPNVRIKPILGVLTELYDRQSLTRQGRVKLSRIRAAQLLALEKSVQDQLKIRWWGSKQLIQLAEKIKNFKQIEAVPVPKGLKSELRHYQQEGLNWLQFLRAYGLGGILADDMGLGKTIQALAHLLVEKEAGRLKGPSLVVAPTSLMTNWRVETEKFAPDLKILVLHGSARQEHFQTLDQYDLIITTYPLIVRDQLFLVKQKFYLLILDEAQIIKNSRSKAALFVNKLVAEHRLCLTGTPLENHLGELWSLFNFLMPGFLGEHKQFTRLFRTPIEKQHHAERRQVLQDRVAPFVLRRTKQGVALELPEKNEITCNIELESQQRDLYESIRLALHDSVHQAVEKKGLANAQIVILDALLKLRQICCDPRLLKLESARNSEAGSAKLQYLRETLPSMVEEGRRILLFSQFTEMLSLIEAEVQALGISYVKLTGQTQDRATPINQFQSGEMPLFLISLKAGGLGLNLTAADTVIHYDPWWNPAIEKQATDRAHRIGQNKSVFVYKLITTGTVEEKIIELQQKKQDLLEILYDDQNLVQKNISAKDLEILFSEMY